MFIISMLCKSLYHCQGPIACVQLLLLKYGKKLPSSYYIVTQLVIRGWETTNVCLLSSHTLSLGILWSVSLMYLFTLW